MIIRIFGSNKCKHCLRMMSTLKNANVTFTYVDAMAPENQNECDKHAVQALPHLQIMTKSGMMLVEHMGELEDDFLLRLVTVADTICADEE